MQKSVICFTTVCAAREVGPRPAADARHVTQTLHLLDVPTVVNCQHSRWHLHIWGHVCNTGMKMRAWVGTRQ